MSTSLRVLMVEDSEDDCELLLRTLRRGSYEVSCHRVDNAAAMSAALADQTWDIVLSDFNMPQFDALAALDQLQRSGHDLPFIVVSGSIGEETAVAAMKAGVHDYVMKGNLVRLNSVIEREVREAQIRRERKQIEAERAQLLVREQAARAEAEKANRAKDEFLAILSHELRTPLTSILGWASMLRSHKVDAETTAQALAVIERNARAQTQLVNDLLDVSRIISGQLRLDVRPVALAPVIEAAMESLRPVAEAKSIHMEAVLNFNMGLVSGDRERLQQVVSNLISNAIKFTPQAGCVEVRLDMSRPQADSSETTGSHVEITVRDTGHGISPEVLPHIFDRFRQADSTSTRRHGGLGLGLAIVRHIVELHGGVVHAQSPGEDQGATFTVTLPVLVAASAAGSSLRDGQQRRATPGVEAPPDWPVLPQGLHVLVVEDELDTREFLRTMLEQSGARVRAVASVAEALAAIEGSHPDVLVSDIGMPHGDGYELIRQVRVREAGRGGSLPAVALTAFARPEDRMHALAAGFQMHLSKPVHPSELIAVVASLAKAGHKVQM